MFVRVLGSAAGGGFPQWNCGCFNCAGVREGKVRAKPRTQESVAVSADGERWVLLNASPEIRAQIESFPKLHPRGPRHSPIQGIVLTNGDLDHCLGLLCLRESYPLTVAATQSVEEGFTSANPLYRTLQRFDGQVKWLRVVPEVPFELAGLRFSPWAVKGKLPIHLEASRQPSPEDNIALEIRDPASGAVLVYLPAVGGLSETERTAAARASCLFCDGTFWSSDELRAIDPKAPLAEQMAHLPIGGAGGSLAQLSLSPKARGYYIHVNNTNPVLREDSEERRLVRERGWDVAWDGLELTL